MPTNNDTTPANDPWAEFQPAVLPKKATPPPALPVDRWWEEDSHATRDSWWNDDAPAVHVLPAGSHFDFLSNAIVRPAKPGEHIGQSQQQSTGTAPQALTPIPMPTHDAPLGMVNPQYDQASDSWSPGQSYAAPAAQPFKPFKPSQQIFSGAYPNPEVVISSHTGQPVAKSWQPLPESKADLKDGNWYRLRRPDGTEYSAMYHGEMGRFFPLDVAQQRPTPESAASKSKDWYDAVSEARAGGWDTPGSKDLASPEAAAKAGLNPNSPFARNQMPPQTPAEQLERNFETYIPGYIQNDAVRVLTHGLMSASANLQGGVARLIGWQSKSQEMNTMGQNIAGAAGVSRERLSSVVPEDVQQAGEGLVDFGTRLAASGGNPGVFAAQSAATEFSKGEQEAKAKGYGDAQSEAYATGRAVTDFLTNHFFFKFGTPQKELADVIRGEASKGVQEAIQGMGKSAATGITVASAGDIARSALDQVSGMNPEALNPRNIGKMLRDTISSQLMFAGISHVVMPLLQSAPDTVREMIDNPNRVNVKKVIGQFVPNPELRQRIADVAKQAASEFEAAPGAGSVEGSEPIPGAQHRIEEDVGAVRRNSQTGNLQQFKVGDIGTTPEGDVRIERLEPDGPIVRNLRTGAVEKMTYGQGEAIAEAKTADDGRTIAESQSGTSTSQPPPKAPGSQSTLSPEDQAENEQVMLDLQRDYRPDFIQQNITHALDILSSRYGKPVVEVGPKNQAEYDAAMFARERGLQPVFVQHEDGGHLPARGLAHDDVVLLRSGQGEGSLWEAVGHEVAHGMRIDTGDHFDESLIDEAADRYAKRAGERRTAEMDADPVLRRREGIAQMVGEFMSDPKFRDQLQQKSPGLWQRVLDAIKRVLGQFTPRDAATRKAVELLRQTGSSTPEYAGAGALLQEEALQTTAAKRASIDRDRESLGLDTIETPEKHSWRQALNEAQQQGLLNRALGMADAVLKSPRSLNDTETAGMVLKANDLKNEHEFLSQQLLKANGSDAKVISAEMNRVQADFDQLSQAIRSSGTEKGRALAAQKLTIDQDWNLLSVKARARAAKGSDLTPKEAGEIESRVGELKKTVDRQKEIEGTLQQTDQAKLKENLQALENSSSGSLSDAARNLRTTLTTQPEAEREANSLAERLKKATPKEMGNLAQRLARYFVGQGVSDRDELVDRVHGELQKALPDFTRRQTADAISGYGDLKELTKDEISVKLRDLKGQLQQVSKLEDMAAGKAPLKSGIERRIPSTEERQLIRQVNEAKQAGGYQSRNAERELQTYIETRRNQLQGEIDEYQRRLQEKDFSAMKRPAPRETPELAELRQQRDELRDQYEKANPNSRNVQRAMQRLNVLEAHLNAGTLPDPNQRQPVSDQRLTEIGERIDVVRNLLARSEPAVRRRFEASIKELTKRLETGDVRPTDRQAPGPLSRELEAIQFQKDLLQRRIQSQIRAMRPRSIPEKIVDIATWWRRESLLSSPVTLAKLTAASLEEMTATPAQEAIGAGIAKVLPQFARRLEAESTSSIRVEADAMAKAVTHLASDMWAKLRHGATDFEAKYGSKQTLPDEMRTYFGNLHGAIKAPVVRQGFERAYAKLTEAYERNGVNINDPFVQMQTGAIALREANRQIFMENNIVASAMQRAATAFNQVDPETGKPTMAGTVAKGIMRTVFPIVRIPTNIVSRTFQGALGLPVGATRLGIEFARGIDELPAQRADAIMRQLKAGSLGAAFLLYGYFNSQNVGGYYQPGEKRKPGDVKAGGTRIGGFEIPGWLQANPFLITMQLGATIRRVAESKLKVHDEQPQGLLKGMEAGAIGTLEDAPLMRDTLDVAKLHDPHQRDKFIEQYGESLVVPAGAKWLMKKVAPEPEKTPEELQKEFKHQQALIKAMQSNPKTSAGFERRQKAIEEYQEMHAPLSQNKQPMRKAYV